MPQALAVIYTVFTAGYGAVSASAVIAAVIEVAAVTYSVVQQRKQKAAAARMQAEAAARARALSSQFAKASKLKETGGTFASASGPRDITEMIRRSTASRRIVYGRARVGGIWIYPETTGSSRETLHLVLALCEGPIEEITTIYFDDEEVTLDSSGNGTGKWAGTVTIKKHLGTAGQAADADLVAASTRWTSAHKLEGIAYLYVKLNLNLELFSSIPEISAVIKGRNDIYDPRLKRIEGFLDDEGNLVTDDEGGILQVGAIGYSTNPALCLNHYLTTSQTGPGIAQADIDELALIHAADICDETVVTLTGTEKRYACQGAIDMASNVEDNIVAFTQAMAGDLIHAGGKFFIQAGDYTAPMFAITLDMMAGPLEFSTTPPRRDRANVLKGTFVSEANSWQSFDFPAIRDPDAITMDGQEVVADMTLDLVGSGTQAQRLASIELKQARLGRTVNLTCNLKVLPVTVGSNVTIDIPRYFAGQVYRVVEYKFSVGGDGAPTIDLTLIETSSSIYDWSTADETLINVPAPLNASKPQVSQPLISGSAPSVTLATLTAGAAIRYSTATAPTSATEGTAYTAPFAVTPPATLYARAFRTGYLDSPLAAEVYT